LRITIEVDCLPEEARRFLGLPGLPAGQEEIVDTLRRETLKRMTDLDAQSLVQA
jgi:hypothetical protein